MPYRINDRQTLAMADLLYHCNSPGCDARKFIAQNDHVISISFELTLKLSAFEQDHPLLAARASGRASREGAFLISP
jgi:hypothetical protein